MRIKRAMRLVAVVLCTVLVLEEPMTALASNDLPAGESVYDDLTESDADPSDGASDPDKLTYKDNLSNVTVKSEADTILEGLEEESLQEGFEAVSDDILLDNDNGTERSVLNGLEDSDSVTEADEEGVIESKAVSEETGNGSPLTYELTGSRTENSLTYSRSDHSFTTFYYTDPVSFKADDGSWRLIDNRLHYSEADGSVLTEEVDINNAAGDKPSDSSEDPDVQIIEESAYDGINSDASKEEIKNKDSKADLQDFDGFSNNDAAFDVKFAEEATTDHIFSFKEGKNSIVLAYVPTVESKAQGSSTNGTDGNKKTDEDVNLADKAGSDIVSHDEADPDTQKSGHEDTDIVINDLEASGDLLSDDNNNTPDTSDGLNSGKSVDKADDMITDTGKVPDSSILPENASKNETQDNNTASWSRKITLLDPKTGDEINKQSLIDACDDTPADADSIEALASSDEDTDVEDPDTAVSDSIESDDAVVSEADAGSEDKENGEEIYYPELPVSQTVLYQDIEDGVDLRYELLPEGIKETIVLSKAEVPASYTFTLNIGTMRAVKNDDGGIWLYGKGSDPVFEIPAPATSDAKGNGDCEAFYEINQSDDGILTLTVKIDESWLKFKSRSFPVEIDPTILKYRRYKSFENLGDFVSVCSDGSKDTETLRVGKGETTDAKWKKSKPVTYRTFIKPKLPEIDAGSVVTDAKMRITAGKATELFYVVPVPDDWDINTISAKKLPFKSVSLQKSLKHISDYGKNGTALLDLTKDVKEMKAKRKGEYGWCFVSADENTDTVRTIQPFKVTDENKKPFLEITYKDFTGTEDYYSAHSTNAGSAGTGSLNDYTGRLTFAHTDATSAGERMPLSISHVYDYAYGSRLGEDKWLSADDQQSAYGEHFRLSTDVRLLIPAGETDVSRYPYVYIDSDGTKHYFKKATVTYFVNGTSKKHDANGDHPAAKDEDGLGLFVVPVTDKNLKDTYPLKIVNKSGSSSMYFDKNGYLSVITDSNQREDEKNIKDKEKNAITIKYQEKKIGSGSENDKLKAIRDDIEKAYDKNASADVMLERAKDARSKLEAFENTSLNASVNLKVALNIQKAVNALNNIEDGSGKYKDGFNSAKTALDTALKEDFIADIEYPLSVTDAAREEALLSYDDNGRLKSMTDPYEDDALITYDYDKNGRLVRINHPNGTYGAYSYDKAGHLTSAVDERGYRIDYAYGEKKHETDQVTRYTEYVGKKAGQTVLVNYDEFNATAFTFSGLDEKTGTKDDIENVYCFDHKGRTISTYSRFKTTKEVIGSTVKSYTDDDEGNTSSANKVKESAGTGSQVINLLTDSSFEKEPGKTGTPAWNTFITDTTGGNAVDKNNTEKYIGSKAGHVIFKAGTSNKEAGFKQTITVPSAGTYTASAYIRTKDLKDAKAKIKISARKASSESSEGNDSESDSTEDSGEGSEASDDEGDEEGSVTSEEGTIDADTQPDINNGWKRIETTIKADKGEQLTLTLSLTGASGEAWFDCAQIEKGDLANQYNLLPNAGFEDGFKENASLPGIPSGWAYGAEAVDAKESVTEEEPEDGSVFIDDADKEEETSDAESDASAVRIVDAKSVGNTIVEGSKVLMITGNPIKRRSVIINPNFGPDKASYTFSCYVKADCAPTPERNSNSNKRKCGIYVHGKETQYASYNEDDATGKYKTISGSYLASVNINTQIQGWQYVTVSLPTRSWNGKLIEIKFDYEVGTLCIDGCMLTKNAVQTKTYTSGGKLKTSQKGERTTTYATDGRERRTKETTAGGASTGYKYDKATNDLIQETHSFKLIDGTGEKLTTKYSYDRFGNQIEVSETANGISQAIVTGTEYGDRGRFAVSQTDSRGNVSTSDYDDNTGLVTLSTDAKGISTSYTYDSFHHPTGVSSEGVIASYSYNSKIHDQLRSIQTGEGKSGETYNFTYDAYGNTKAVTRSTKDKKLVANTYMPNNGKIKTTTYGNGNKITYGYNTLEQLTSESWNSKDVTRYEYDNRGNKARITDTLSGLKYRYFYDDKGRITTAEITKTIGKTSSELISFQSIYDKAGRQSVFVYYTGGRAYRTEYGYTSDDKVGAATLPSGGTFKRTYDGFDRITKDIFTPQAKPGTGETTKRGGGAAVTSTYGYLGTDRDPKNDQADGIDGVKYKYTTRLISDLNVTIGSGKTAKTAVSEILSYDNLGRIDSWGINSSAYSENSNIADSSKTTYTYDNLGRLIKAADTGNDRTWEYSYDSIGNITSSIYTDKEGEHKETYSYDRDNLTKYNGEKVDGYKGGNPKTYLGNTLTWARGRQLMSVTPAKKRSEYSAEDTVTFTYAYDGSRLSKTVSKTKKNSGTTTEYILNGSTILAQNTTYPDGSKETLNFYYSSDGKLLEIGYLKGDENGNISKDAVETHYSVIRNAMGDVAAIYTADGTLVGTYEYDPYGRLLSETSNPSYTDTDDILHKNPFRYRGYYYDQETKWYYLQSRYYDPQVKRFINADSTDLLTSDCADLMQYNLFMYCNGDPVNGDDPSGHFAIMASLGIIAAGAIIGGLVGAYTAAASGGDIEQGIKEGLLLGGVGTACALIIPELMALGGAALATAGATETVVSVIGALSTPITMTVAGGAGAFIDYKMQDSSVIEGQEIDKGRVIKTGIETGLCAGFPAFSPEVPFGAFGTALAWGEGTTLVGFADSIWSHVAGDD